MPAEMLMSGGLTLLWHWPPYLPLHAVAAAKNCCHEKSFIIHYYDHAQCHVEETGVTLGLGQLTRDGGSFRHPGAA